MPDEPFHSPEMESALQTLSDYLQQSGAGGAVVGPNGAIRLFTEPPFDLVGNLPVSITDVAGNLVWLGKSGLVASAEVEHKGVIYRLSNLTDATE